MGGKEPQKGEVWLVPFPMPSADKARAKFRPAVVVSAASPSDTNGTVTVAAISSATHRLTGFDIPVECRTRVGKQMGMDRDGAIFCAILHTFSAAAFVEQIGSVNAKLLAQIDANLKRLLFSPEPDACE